MNLQQLVNRGIFVSNLLKHSSIGQNCIVLLFIFVITFLRVDFNAVPFEDAAILMRYAENFAEGFGIVWNPGSLPVDGATDFLFVIITGFLKILTGAGIEPIVQFLNIYSHIVSIYIAYYTLRAVLKAPFVLSIITTLYLLLGPGAILITSKFATPFFVLLVTMLWLTTIMIIINTDKNKFIPLIFGALSLLVGLARPEGVFLSLFFLLSIILARGVKSVSRLIIYYMMIMLILGGVYFVWRWQYFGYPFPNPYYRKMGSGFNIESLKMSVIFTFKFIFPFIPILMFAFIEKPRVKSLMAISLPAVAFTLIFGMIDSSMNFMGRFQYVNMFIIGMSWWLPLRGLKVEEFLSEKFKSNVRVRNTLRFITLFCIIAVFVFQVKYNTVKVYADGRYDIGVILSSYQARGYKIACSEAGLIPYYSKLTTLDTWGLNDQEIAHSGLITDSILIKFDPDLIMFHAAFSPLIQPKVSTDHQKMGILLKQFAERNDYSLIACFGVDPFVTHYYYLKRGILDFASINEQIKSLKYIWYENGVICVNFSENRL